MLRWIKSIEFEAWMIILLVLITLGCLVGLTFGAGAQEVKEYYIPVQVSPGSSRIVFVPSYDPGIFDLDNFYEKSNETGLYPTFGWTGEYYETRVTHGPVETWAPDTTAWQENLMLGVSKSGSNRIYSCGDETAPVVPEPSSLTGLLILGFEFLRRRR